MNVYSVLRVPLKLKKTHPSAAASSHIFSSAVNEDIRPVAFLVHDARELAIVVDPRRGWLPSKALDASKGGVLDADYNVTKPAKRQ